MRPPQLTRLQVAVAALCLSAVSAAAQNQPPSTTTQPTQEPSPRTASTAPASASPDQSATSPQDQHAASPPQEPSATPPDQRAEPDETVINLPTTLSLKAHHSYFRLTHRFARDLRRGGFSELSQDLFSLDNGALIGLEYRFAISSRLQAGLHRASLGKAINTFGRWDAVAQGTSPIALSIGAGFEGQNNLRQDYQPNVWATVSHTHGNWLALYATPSYVHNAHTATLLALHAGHEHATVGGDNGEDNPARNTWFIGLGTRVRFRPTAFFVMEASPRISGYKPDRATWNVGIEKQTHGHMFQLNFGNSFDTTPGQIARGGDKSQVFMGFNISRKF
jgi:uncharacterized beta barrel domain-containing protein DUF5777